MLTETETPTVGDITAAGRQRGQAPFFNSSERPAADPAEEQDRLDAETEYYAGMAEPTFVEELEAHINAYRFPDGKRYRKLEGSEIATIPSVESQIASVEQAIQQWLGETVIYAESVSFDPHDEGVVDAVGQIEYLVGQGNATAEQYGYWAQFYRTSEQNESGRFVKWASRRRVAEFTGPIVARRRKAGEKRLDEGVVQTVSPSDNSDLAKNRDLRRRAYRARMDTKIGLAAARVFTLDRIAMLTEYLPFPTDDVATPSVIRECCEKRSTRPTQMPSINELLSRLELPDLPERTSGVPDAFEATPEWQPVRDEDLIPF